MLDQTSPDGARVLTGFWVLRGKEATEIGGLWITNLNELIAAVYEGTISDDVASKCVFTTDAQEGAVVSVLQTHVIYQADDPDGPGRVEFAMPRGGSDDPLLAAPVRYIGREEFTTGNGTVRLIPVVVIERGIE